MVNDGYVHNWDSAIVSGIQWGTLNTANTLLGVLGGPTSNLETGLLSGMFGSVTSFIGMAIDILRNRQNPKDTTGFNSINAYNF